MRLETIRLGRIRIRDQRFRISFFFDVDALAGSIARFGLLNPPLVRPVGRGFVLISGWKRVLACRRAGMAEICAIVTDETDDLKVFRAAVEENRTHRALSLTEKAEILKKLRTFGLGEGDLIREIMPRLEVPATPAHLRTLGRLALARRDVRRYVHARSIPFPVLESLLKFGDSDRTRLLPILCFLGQNKQREVLDDLWGVCRRDGFTVRRLLGSGEIGRALRSEALPQLQRAERARRLLRQRRYPALSARQGAFEVAFRKLKMPGEITVQPSPYFEDENVSLCLRFKSPAELRDRLKKIEGLASQPDFVRLFRE